MISDAHKQKLITMHKEEMEDRNKYLALADELEHSGKHCAAGICRDIAHDESTHAEAISHVLDKEEHA